MCCIIVWLPFLLILVLGTFFFIGGYYTYLALLYIISVIFIIVAIITKKQIIYKIGYYTMFFYAGLDIIYSVFFIATFWFFKEIYWNYVGFNPYINIYYKANSDKELEELIKAS